MLIRYERRTTQGSMDHRIGSYKPEDLTEMFKRECDAIDWEILSKDEDLSSYSRKTSIYSLIQGETWRLYDESQDAARSPSH